MNKKVLLLGACVLLCAASCKEKKSDNEEIIVERVMPAPVKTVTSMPAESNDGYAKWIDGKEYHYVIQRTAIDSTAAVENYGHKYRENSIELAIKRPDGTVFFTKKLLKSDFTGLLDQEHKEHGILLNVAYDKTDANNMYFVASIGSPDETNEDEVLVQYIVNRMGSTQVAKYELKFNPEN